MPPTSAPPVLSRARSASLRLRPGDRFSHTTAAHLWSVDLPAGEDALHVTATPPRNPPRWRGVLGHVDERTHRIRHGLPVSSPARTFVECAHILSLAEAVAVGDSLVLDPEVLDPRDVRPLVTRDELAEHVRSSTGAGVRRARLALAYVRAGSASRPESLLRMLIVTAGLPEPELQVEVQDAAGRFIGRVDMAYPGLRIAVEYDGQQHRTSDRQYEIDAIRTEQLHAAGWIQIRVRKHGLFATPDATLDRIRNALRARGFFPNVSSRAPELARHGKKSRG